MRILTLACLLVLLSTSAPLAGSERPETPPAQTAVGQMAPDFTLPNTQGQSVRLADLQGKVVFLNFWATWCPPCRAEMPAMERLHEAFGGKNLAVVAVNVEDLSAVTSYLEKNRHAFTVLLDPEGEVQNLYGVFRLPETFLIDKQGRIVQHYLGARDWSSVEFLRYVSSLINE